MTMIPLEDSFTDILGKAQRGAQLNDADLAAQAGIPVEMLTRVKGGVVDLQALPRLAKTLRLGPAALVASAQKSWYPRPHAVEGLAQINTTYEDMTVNAYLVWDPATREAAVFDTGADVGPILQAIAAKQLRVNLILLTHTHPDHIADLARLKRETGAPVYVGALEPTEGAETFPAGRSFSLGRLAIETRQTSGHSVGGITYVISGLAVPVAVVGDAIFAGSMGGGGISYSDALSNNRKHLFSLPDTTVLCPGHGPLSTVGEEKQHNPFYPEFQNT